MRSTELTVGVVVLLAASGLEGQQAAQGLEGAWRVTEVVTTGRLGAPLAHPSPAYCSSRLLQLYARHE